MKIQVFEINQERIGELPEWVEKRKFREKPESELKGVLSTVGFVVDEEFGIGDSDIQTFKYRVDERKVPGPVRKRLLSSKKFKEFLSNFTSSKEKKQAQQEALRELALRQDFSTTECRVVVRNGFMFFIDPKCEIVDHMRPFFTKIVNMNVEEFGKGYEDSNEGITIALSEGKHTFEAAGEGGNKYSMDGNLKSSGISDLHLKKVSVVSTSGMYGDMKYSVTSDAIQISKKELMAPSVKFAGEEPESPLDILCDAFERLEALVVRPAIEMWAEVDHEGL